MDIFCTKVLENILTYFQIFSAKISRFWSKKWLILQDFGKSKNKNKKKPNKKPTNKQKQKNKTKQNKTKQNKTKNKTKQNKKKC